MTDDWFTDIVPTIRSDIPKSMQVTLDKIYSRRSRLLAVALRQQERVNRENIRKRYERYPTKPIYPDKMRRQPVPIPLTQLSVTHTAPTSTSHWYFNESDNLWVHSDEPKEHRHTQIQELDLTPFLDFTDFSINDYVLRRHPQEVGTSGPINKYSSWWRGPYLVIDKKWHTKKGKWVYTIRNLVNLKCYEVDVTHIKPFYFDPTYTTPLHVAVRDTDEYVVDHIVEHKLTDTGHLWRVRWADYSDADDTWEPFEHLKDVDAFHVYCKTHRLRQYLPEFLSKRKPKLQNDPMPISSDDPM
jgi:hypothetical protein